jgi:hypothetical protein
MAPGVGTLRKGHMDAMTKKIRRLLVSAVRSIAPNVTLFILIAVTTSVDVFLPGFVERHITWHVVGEYDFAQAVFAALVTVVIPGRIVPAKSQKRENMFTDQGEHMYELDKRMVYQLDRSCSITGNNLLLFPRVAGAPNAKEETNREHFQ